MGSKAIMASDDGFGQHRPGSIWNLKLKRYCASGKGPSSPMNWKALYYVNFVEVEIGNLQFTAEKILYLRVEGVMAGDADAPISGCNL